MEDLFVATMNIGNVACIEALANTAGKHANSSKVGDFIISLGQPAVLVQEGEMISEENNPIFQRPVINPKPGGVGGLMCPQLRRLLAISRWIMLEF